MKKKKRIKQWILDHPCLTGTIGVGIGGLIYYSGYKLCDFEIDWGLKEAVNDGYIKLTRPSPEDGPNSYEVIDSISEWVKLLKEKG